MALDIDTPEIHEGFTDGLRPEVQLLDRDGNAFAILGACQRQAKAAGVPASEISEFMDKAMDGDYNHLLRTVMDYFEVS